MHFLLKNFCITVVLFFPVLASAQHTIVLQPDGDCGKDAMIWNLQHQFGQFGATNTKNYSDIENFTIMEWTWNGSRGHRWALLDFMSNIEIPEGLEITAARLSLFAPVKASSDGFHSLYEERRKHSVGVVARILEPWEESTVCWDNRPAFSNRGEIVLPIPGSERSNFENIDVTDLVREMVQSPGENHGFMIRMQEDNHYRKLVFAASDSDVAELRPRLEIDYVAKQEIEIPESCSPEIDCTPIFTGQFFPRLGNELVYQPILPSEGCEFNTFTFRVFDSKGKEVFFTDTPEEGWDGTFKNRTLESGQYSYHCLFAFEGDEWLQVDSGIFLMNQ